MSKYKQILTGLLATAYNQAPEEIAELLDKSDEELNEKEVLNAIKEKDKARIAELRTKTFDEGFKKAEKQSKSEFEKLIKEKFELSSDKKGQELVDEIFELSTKPKEGTDPKEVTDDDVKRHPAFLTMEKSYKKQMSDLETDFKTQVAAKEKEYHRKDVLGKVGKTGLGILDKMKPILSKDAEKAQNQKGIFLKEFDRFDFEENENAPGGFLVFKDGQLFTDEHGNRVDFDKLAAKIADKYFDFEVAEERSAPGERRDQDSSKTKYNGAPPKTKEEYAKLITDKSIPLAERIAIREATPPELKN